MDPDVAGIFAGIFVTMAAGTFSLIFMRNMVKRKSVTIPATVALVATALAFGFFGVIGPPGPTVPEDPDAPAAPSLTQWHTGERYDLDSGQVTGDPEVYDVDLSAPPYLTQAASAAKPTIYFVGYRYDWQLPNVSCSSQTFYDRTSLDVSKIKSNYTFCARTTEDRYARVHVTKVVDSDPNNFTMEVSVVLF